MRSKHVLWNAMTQFMQSASDGAEIERVNFPILNFPFDASPKGTVDAGEGELNLDIDLNISVKEEEDDSQAQIPTQTFEEASDPEAAQDTQPIQADDTDRVDNSLLLPEIRTPVREASSNLQRLESVASESVSPDAYAATLPSSRKRTRTKGHSNEGIVPLSREGSKALAALKKKAGPASLSETLRRPQLHLPLANGEPTLWDLVMRNTREVSAAELEARQKAREAAAAAEAEAEDAANRDEIAELFGDTGKKNTTGRRQETDLFGGGEDMVASNALTFDESGNFVIEEDQGNGSLWNADDQFGASAEGRQLIMEDLEEEATAEIKPFKGAYKVTKAVKWSEDDEKQLYKALRLFGIDFMMIHTLMPQFTMKQIRDKLKAEERRNPEKIDSAARSKLTLTTASYEKIHGVIDPSTHFRADDDDIFNGQLGLPSSDGLLALMDAPAEEDAAVLDTDELF